MCLKYVSNIDMKVDVQSPMPTKKQRTNKFSLFISTLSPPKIVLPNPDEDCIDVDEFPLTRPSEKHDWWVIEAKEGFKRPRLSDSAEAPA